MRKMITVFFSLLFLNACDGQPTSQVKAEADEISAFSSGFEHLKQVAVDQGLSPEAIHIRTSTCWKNPVADGLTDAQKTFYCYFPLEFRLCNSVVLLLSKEETEENQKKRVDGYYRCKKLTHFEEALAPRIVDSIYFQLYLDQGKSLSPEVVDSLHKAYRPEISALPFPILLLKVQKDLAGRAFASSLKQIQSAIASFIQPDAEPASDLTESAL